MVLSYSFYSYIQYSNIAAKIVRRVLKPEFKADAAKREDSHVKFTAWKDGKPESKFFSLSFVATCPLLVLITYINFLSSKQVLV